MRNSEERTDPQTGQRQLLVRRRGLELMGDSLLNKGTCFSLEEREQFGLGGLLPPAVSSYPSQQQRAYGNYLAQPDEVARFLYLTALQDRNETLFYRLLVDHIEELMPVVYTPTVGIACQRFSHIYRRPRGIYINLHHRGRIRRVLEEAPIDDCRVMVVTDNEAILGLGDLGVGGMGIPIGKLSLYTAGAGVHPGTCLPIDLDVGTNNADLLKDPLYLGIREPRVRGEEYFSLLDEFVEAVQRVFPRAIVQWEDFANENAFTILERYRDQVPSFDDDIQGTGSVIVAGLLAAVERAGRDLRDERAVFFGAGASGGGCALAFRTALTDAGLTEEQARARVLCLDSRGLILKDRPGLPDHKALLAADPGLVKGWKSDRLALAEVVEEFRPTILAGMSGQAGAFSEQIIRTMHKGCDRPIIFPCSNPTSMAEATPRDLIDWTDGRAIVATGSPFDPVTHGGRTHEIGQANNVLVFPGVGLGAIAVEARTIPDSTFLAAAMALHRLQPGDPASTGSLFPPLPVLREVSRAVARAVGRELVKTGSAPGIDDSEIDRRIDALVWEPRYLPYLPAT